MSTLRPEWNPPAPLTAEARKPPRFFGAPFSTQVGQWAFEVRSEFSEVREWLARDYLLAPALAAPSALLKVQVMRAVADGLKMPLRSRRSQWRLSGNRSEAFYFGAVAVYYDPQYRRALVAGTEATLVYEALEFLLAAYLGEQADGAGWHRVHGLGVTFRGQGVLFLGAAGAGKTTLGADLFYHREASYFSDDVPWVSRGGTLHANPHRFSFKTFPRFPADRVRPHRRPLYGERYFVDAGFFKERWSAPRPLEKIYLLKRGQVRGCFLQSRWRVLGWLMRWLVVGLETPQIFELRLRPGRDSVAAGLKALASRLRTALFLARTVPGYTLTYLPGDHPAKVLDEE